MKRCVAAERGAPPDSRTRVRPPSRERTFLNTSLVASTQSRLGKRGAKEGQYSLILLFDFKITKFIHIQVTQWCAVSFGQLLQLVVVGQDEERSLNKVHGLHLGHDVLVDAIHDLLEEEQDVKMSSGRWN